MKPIIGGGFTFSDAVGRYDERLVVFCRRSTPTSDLSRRICEVTAGWVSPKSWAALVKLPNSLIATKVRSRSVGMQVRPRERGGSALVVFSGHGAPEARYESGICAWNFA